MCVLYVSYGSNIWPRTLGGGYHGLCSVVYFEVQIALILCRVWSEQSANCLVWI